MNVSKSRRLWAACLTASVVATGGSVAEAQETPSAAMLEEVVVSARKREETLIEVPVAVTAISAADIEQRGIQSLGDVALYTPGLTYFDSLNSALGTPVVRGIAQTNLNSPDRNVAVFYGGVYLANLSATNLEILDVDRIEVVKGPQSALYGRNAFNGAINYVPAAPARELTGRVQATVGSDERGEGKLLVSGPFSDTLRGRLALSYNTFDGSWENTADPGNGLGGYETKNVSGSLEYQPNDALRINLFGFYTDDQRGPGSYYIYAAQNCGPTGRPLSAVCGPLEARDALAANPAATGLGRKVHLESLDISYDFGPVSLVSQTSYYDAAVDILTDYDGNGTGYPYAIVRNSDINAIVASMGVSRPVAAALAPVVRTQNVAVFSAQGEGQNETWSQELRLESEADQALRWSAGAFYFKNDYNSSISAAFDNRQLAAGELPRDALFFAVSTPAIVAPPSAPLMTSDNVRKDEQVAVFGSLEYDVTDSLTIGGELRRDREDREQYNRLIGQSSLQQREFEYTTWRAHVDYSLAPTQKFYVSAAKGVTSGYFNSTFDAFAQQTVPAELQAYDPAENKTYEFGWKAEWLDRRLGTELALFYIDYTGIQINATPPPPLVTNLIQNLGKARARGIEASANFAVTDGIRVGATYSYTPTEFGENTPEPGVARYCGAAAGIQAGFCPGITFRGQLLPDVGGQSLPRAPETTASLYGSFEAPLAGDWSIYGRADLSYVSKAYTLTWNLGEIPSRTLTNARLGLRRGPLDVALWGRNLLDRKYVSAVIFQPSFFSGQFLPNVSQGERATYGLTATYSFGAR